MITEITPPATIELLNRGMECLIREMGIVEAEYFIAAVQRERFDKADLRSFVDKAASFAEENGK